MKGLELIKALKQATCDKCCKDFRTDICKNCDYIIIEKELKALDIIIKKKLIFYGIDMVNIKFDQFNYWYSQYNLTQEEFGLLKEVLKNE